MKNPKSTSRLLPILFFGSIFALSFATCHANEHGEEAMIKRLQVIEDQNKDMLSKLNNQSAIIISQFAAKFSNANPQMEKELLHNLEGLSSIKQGDINPKEIVNFWKNLKSDEERKTYLIDVYKKYYNARDIK